MKCTCDDGNSFDVISTASFPPGSAFTRGSLGIGDEGAVVVRRGDCHPSSLVLRVPCWSLSLLSLHSLAIVSIPCSVSVRSITVCEGR